MKLPRHADCSNLCLNIKSTDLPADRWICHTELSRSMLSAYGLTGLPDRQQQAGERPTNGRIQALFISER
jgi:hypothetical protein